MYYGISKQFIWPNLDILKEHERVKAFREPVVSRDLFFLFSEGECKAIIYRQKRVKLYIYRQRCEFTDRSVNLPTEAIF